MKKCYSEDEATDWLLSEDYDGKDFICVYREIGWVCSSSDFTAIRPFYRRAESFYKVHFIIKDD